MQLFKGACVAAIFISYPLHAQEIDNTEWLVWLKGGTTLYSQGDGPRFASIALTREFDSGYIELSASMIDSGTVPSVVNAVPSKSDALTVSAGKTLGNISLDAYMSVGRRRFQEESFERLGRTITIDSDGKSFATGGSATYDLAVADRLFLSPYLAVDYDRIDIARAIVLGNANLQWLKSKQDGVSGTAGATLQRMFGADAQHVFGVSAAFIATSNSTAARSGSTGNLVSRVVAARNQPGQSDEWVEVGTTASVALSKNWQPNIAATRTLGFTGPEATSLSTGISFGF